MICPNCETRIKIVYRSNFMKNFKNNFESFAR